jgi:HlyD family secretion protein
MRRHWLWTAAGAGVLIIGIWLRYGRPRLNPGYEYSGTVETREIQVGSKIGGRVIAVPVEEGDAVKAGQLLVRFECDELRAQHGQAVAAVQQAQADLQRMELGNRPEEIEQAEAAVRAQQAALEAAENGPRQQEIQQAQADYAAANADAVNAEVNFHRMESLVAKEEIARQQFDDARNKRDSTAERAESARQRWALLQAGTRSEDLRAARARYQQAEAAAVLARKGFRKEDIEMARGRLTEAKARVAELDARLREAELRAPADAVLEVVSVRPGDLVSPGQIVMTMLESSQLWVKIYVPETELAHVRLGEGGTVAVDTFPRRTFRGRVAQIAAEAEFLPRNVQTRDDREHQVYGVRVYVDNPEGVLKSGMSATVRFE